MKLNHCSQTQQPVRNLRTALRIIDIFLLDGSFEIIAIPDRETFFAKHIARLQVLPRDVVCHDFNAFPRLAHHFKTLITHNKIW